MNDNAFCPIWGDTSVKDEILVFVKEDGEVFANLLFDGVEELVITDREGRLLEKDKDYFIKGNRVCAINEVPYFEDKWLKNIDVPQFINSENEVYKIEGCLLFSPKDLREFQLLASYKHKYNNAFPNVLSDRLELPKTYDKLKAGKVLNMALFGDSISNAANSSWEMGYGGRHWICEVKDNIERFFNARVNVSNFSRSGYGTEWALNVVDEKFSSPQDLVILAFGMNDGASDMTVAEFVENNKQIIKQIKEKNPNTEFVIISPPVPNENCEAVYKEQVNYKNGLRNLVGNGVAMINMTDVFLELVKKKRYCEISGNNLNHPNDFGYKFYIDAVTYLFYRLKIRNENKLESKEFFYAPMFEEKKFDLPENIKGGYIINNVYGKECKTFAFIGYPKDVKGKVPAVVLAHGGGGNAYWKWVKEWVNRGYIAISIDLNGTHFVGTLEERTYNGLINDKLIRNYVCVDEPPECSWTYYSVAQIISAHSYLLSLPEVDKDRTGVVGISWGGVMSLIAIGLDKRFSLAAIIYSAGFISEDLLGRETETINTNAKKDYYDTFLDPLNYVSDVSIPVLFNAGLTDGAFSPFNRKRTYDLMNGNVCLAIKDELLHDNESNFRNEVVYHFFDDILKNKPRPSLSGKVVEGKLILLSGDEGMSEVYYTFKDGDPHKIKWEKENLYLKKGENVYFIKDGVKHLTASLFYGDGLYVSCDLFSL